LFIILCRRKGRDQTLLKLNCINTSNISQQLNKKVTVGRACGTHGEKNAYRILQENLKDKENT
jgi:hypothetical protein